jgi:tetratricopeptide (TPR) repeat protein
LEKKRKEKDSQQNIVRTTSERNTHDLEKIGVDWGIWTGRSHLHLATLTSESKDSTRNCEMISRKATSFVTLSDVSTIHAQYGMPYLMFLACWSGLHKAPWSFCNVTRAREIIRFARESLSLCEREWGRKMSSIEEIMLNLGEADAECGFLSGGFTDKAKEIYENVISDITGKDMHGLDSLLQSHCLSGLIMITLSQTDSDSQDIQSLYAKGVDDAKLSLKHLTLLQESCEMPTSFQNWRSLDAFPSSLTFHLCKLRTLVAESLIRSLKPMEAEGFLKQAVTDSSSNFDAAFVLGAFWLRMSFSSNAGKNEYTKKAQVQLLKSLKLDTTKADPFSLLGVWYEVHGDLKRALGCYSKALLIDPSHPVAGRGILRLRNPKEVTNICTEAVSVSSNTSGWAWKALGDSKALIDGLDEEAILCYQQALRHRDIESAKQHTLSVFFAFPFHADGENKECSATWSALASCYRRLGKYSASLRAYESAFVNGHSDDYICAWAQGK